jgi:site-specific DNA-methyltransferase (adenine-specific)
VVLDEEAGAALDAQSGKRPSASNTKPSTGGTIMSGLSGEARPNGYRAFANGNPYRGENGGASRFFYCAKASRTERDAGLDGFAIQQTQKLNPGGMAARREEAGLGLGRNVHPTVKPLALAAYLARLILPPVEGSRLLVPFCGSGSEMIGGLRAGWSHVEGIDSWDVAVKIARARLAHHEALLAKTEEAEQLSLVGT